MLTCGLELPDETQARRRSNEPGDPESRVIQVRKPMTGRLTAKLRMRHDGLLCADLQVNHTPEEDPVSSSWSGPEVQAPRLKR
jgi:hypothetical protein